VESGSVVRDGVGITHVGHPAAPYLSLGSGPSHPIDLGELLASPRWRFRRWTPHTLPGKAEAKARGAGTKTLITLVSKNAIATGV